MKISQSHECHKAANVIDEPGSRIEFCITGIVASGSRAGTLLTKSQCNNTTTTIITITISITLFLHVCGHISVILIGQREIIKLQIYSVRMGIILEGYD